MQSARTINHRCFSNSLHRFLPVYAFLFVYVITCLIGAMMFIFEQNSFMAFYEYFSGAAVPQPNRQQEIASLLLLWLALGVLLGGFAIGTHALDHVFRRKTLAAPVRTSPLEQKLVFALFTVSAVTAFFSLQRGEAFSHLGAWSDYATFVAARWALFHHMGFFEFANIYIFLPMLTAGVLVLIPHPLNIRRTLLSALLVCVPLAASLMLFQKRIAVLNILVITCSMFTFVVRNQPKTAKKFLYGGLTTAIILYFVLVVIPAYKETSRTIVQAQEVLAELNSAETPQKKDKLQIQEANERTLRLAEELNMDKNRFRQVAIYSIMSPFTRTSSSSLFYPIMFPAEHPYYPLDIGQDILGFGSMPDHGAIVWSKMNPNIPGSTTAPYQFVLYSQIGVLGSIIASALIGLLLGFGWRCSQSSSSEILRTLSGGCIVLFAIYLAMDGVRDGIFSSYGVIWFMLPLTLLGIGRNLMGRVNISRAATKSN